MAGLTLTTLSQEESTTTGEELQNSFLVNDFSIGDDFWEKVIPQSQREEIENQEVCLCILQTIHNPITKSLSNYSLEKLD